jgi:hypothetical protein
MTVLPPDPMTAIGFPRSFGLDCCSTEAKNASMSMQRIILDIHHYLTQPLIGEIE